jgi:Lon protease-like protein
MALRIFEVRYLDLIKRCQREQQAFGVVLLHQGREVQQAGVTETLGGWGCTAHLESVEALQPALLQVQCRGGQRFEVLNAERGAYGRWRGQVRLLPPDPVLDLPPDLQFMADQLGRLIADAQGRGMASMLPLRPPYRLDEAGWVANRWAELWPLAVPFKEHLLATDDPLARLRMLAQVFKAAEPGPSGHDSPGP